MAGQQTARRAVGSAPSIRRIETQPSDHPPARAFDANAVRNLLAELARQREEQGLTQSEVARQMGTSQPYIARLEAAQVDPRLSTLLRYAAVVAGGIAVAAVLRELLRSAAPR